MRFTAYELDDGEVMSSIELEAEGLEEAINTILDQLDIMGVVPQYVRDEGIIALKYGITIEIEEEEC